MKLKNSYNKLTIFSWSLYDFANQPFTTLVVTFIYSAYFANAIVLDNDPENIYGTALWSRAISVTALFVALLSPFMGSVADRGGYRKIFFIFWTWLCVISSILLFFAEPGDVAMALFWFIIANVAFEMGGVFCNSYLIDIAPRHKIGRISGYGWSFGYVGGLLALILSLILFVNPEVPAFGFTRFNGENYRAVTILCGVWLAIFSLPTFLFVKDGPVRNRLDMYMIKDSYNELILTFTEIKKYKQIVRFLLARLFYNDGLITIFAFGGIYAVSEFGFTLEDVLLFGIVLNIFAGLGSFLMGFLDDYLGGKNTIQISNLGLILAAIIAVLTPNQDIVISLPLLLEINIPGVALFWFSGILMTIISSSLWLTK